MKRLIFLAVMISAIIPYLAGCQTGPEVPDVESFDGNKFVGNIWPDAVGTSAVNSEFWNQVTPANDGKWGVAENGRDFWYWSGLDAISKYTSERNIPFRFHTLVWGQQEPEWIKDLPPGEQLKEVKEWFKLAGQRYPDVDFIDVVNEALHEYPSYADALGGKGRTGWDWVVTSFKLARKYFPNAKLHINDYNILKSPMEAKKYVEIIEILKARRLIDGVGMQAHFLEETKVSTAKACLDIVAETGLPLYITEFDVDIEDDLLQARKFEELFTLFYEYPKIAGITLWGSTEFRMWRKNGYLIDRNGEYRMSMKWLDSYLNGDGSFVIPEFVQQPRAGENGVNRIEAETFDENRGVQVLENTLSYIDRGDWAMYKMVDFQPEYSRVKVRYSKGGKGTVGSVKFVLDAPDGHEAAVFELPNTGGWSDFAELEAEWPGTEGVHDVYLVFDGVRDIASIDYFEFASAETAE